MDLDTEELRFRNALPDSPSYVRKISAPQFTRFVLELLIHSLKLLHFQVMLPELFYSNGYATSNLKFLWTFK